MRVYTQNVCLFLYGIYGRVKENECCANVVRHFYYYFYGMVTHSISREWRGFMKINNPIRIAGESVRRKKKSERFHSFFSDVWPFPINVIPKGLISRRIKGEGWFLTFGHFICDWIDSLWLSMSMAHSTQTGARLNPFKQRLIKAYVLFFSLIKITNALFYNLHTSTTCKFTTFSVNVQ